MIKYLSLFSGIGAFEKSLQRLQIPYELVGYCEIDKYASKAYSLLHKVPESMNFGDITKIDETTLPDDIDLITYGFPCQDISLAGHQKGLLNDDDGSKTRSGLLFDALRIIEHTQPKIAIAENVKNLTSKKFSEQFNIILQSLESAGYNNYWKVLNAKDYEIPQNRERIIIVSIRKDIDTGIFEFPEPVELKLRLKDLLEDEVDEKTQKYFGNKYLKTNVLDKAFKMKMAKLDGEIAICLTARSYASANTQYVTRKNGEQTIVSRKEVFRLMGFDDADVDLLIENGISNTQLYKMAGNSISVNMLEFLFCQIFDNNNEIWV